MHNAYIVELCNTTLATLKSKITEVMTPTTSALKLLDGLYQEIVWHTHYATSKLEDFYVSVGTIYFYNSIWSIATTKGAFYTHRLSEFIIIFVLLL